MNMLPRLTIHVYIFGNKPPPGLFIPKMRLHFPPNQIIGYSLFWSLWHESSSYCFAHDHSKNKCHVCRGAGDHCAKFMALLWPLLTTSDCLCGIYREPLTNPLTGCLSDCCKSQSTRKEIAVRLSMASLKHVCFVMVFTECLEVKGHQDFLWLQTLLWEMAKIWLWFTQAFITFLVTILLLSP